MMGFYERLALAASGACAAAVPTLFAHSTTAYILTYRLHNLHTLHRYKVFGQQRLDSILTWIGHPSHCPWRYCVRPLPRAKDWQPTLRAQLVEQ